MGKIDGSRPFVPVNIAVLTVSDTRTAADDKSGATLVERIIASGHKVVAHKIVTDDQDKIVSEMQVSMAVEAI